MCLVTFVATGILGGLSKIDLAIAGMTVTDKRKEVVDFPTRILFRGRPSWSISASRT